MYSNWKAEIGRMNFKKWSNFVLSLRDVLCRHKETEDRRTKKKECYVDNNQKRAEVATLISDSTEFKTKTVNTEKGKHFPLKKGSSGRQQL